MTGNLTLDGPQLQDLVDSADGWESARAVIMHELAHAIGLDHVDDSGELMQPKGSGDVTDWGPGDLEGLSALGSGRCIDC